MYKSQFSLWKLEKNMTMNRALHAVERNVACVSSVTEFSADSKKIRAYLHRLPDGEREYLLARILDTSKAERSINTVASPVSLLPPTEFFLPEGYFHLLNSYVKGSFEAESWPRDEMSGLKNEDTVPAWCSSIMSATWVLAEGKGAEANRFLLHFIEEAVPQLSRQDPRLFPFLYTSVLSFAKQRPDIAQWLIQALCTESEKLPWANSSHPLRLLLQLMLRLGPEDIIIHASNILLAYISIIQDALGGAYPIIQDMMSDTIFRLTHHDLLSVEEVVSLGRHMTLVAELQKRDRCKDYLNLKMNLAGAYLKMGNVRDARSTTTEVMNTQLEVANSERMMPSLHMLICRINEADGQVDDAIVSVLRAVVASIEIFGEFSDWTLNSLIMYRKVLARAGRLEEEQRIIKDRDLTIDKLSSRFEEVVNI
jgi:hypothetical protein